eukprot:scaffold6360_cov66-Phaeocystis_antarctica.AAC.3
MDTAPPPPKKSRRLVPTPVLSAVVGPPSQLELHPTVELSVAEGVSATLTLPFAATETVNSAEQFCRLLQREAEQAQETHERWMRQPHAPWVQELAAELSVDSAARSALLAGQRKLQGVSEDAAARWEAGAELASAVVELWLEGKSLEQVLAKSEALGHAQQRSGLVLSGRFARELAAKQDVTLEQLLPWVTKIVGGAGGAAGAVSAADGVDGAADGAATSATSSASASLFRVDPANAFASLPGTRCPLPALPAELRQRLASGAACGSLDTTWQYVDEDEDEGSGATRMSGVALLDEYWAALDGALYGAHHNTLRLNPRLFLLWKLQGYCTPVSEY